MTAGEIANRIEDIRTQLEMVTDRTVAVETTISQLRALEAEVIGCGVESY